MSRRPRTPPEHEVRRYGDLTILRRLFREARGYRTHIGLVFLIGLLATPIALLTPLPLKIAVDSVIGSHGLPGFLETALPAWATESDTAVLVFAVSLFVAVAALDQLQALSTTVLGTYTGEKLVLRFRTRLFRHVQRLSLAYHDTRGTADAVYRIQYDAPSIQYVAVYGLTPFVTSLFTLAGMIYVTARIDGQLALVALAVAPVLFALTWLARRRLRSGWREAKHLESSALSVVQEVLTGLRVVKSFGQEVREEGRFVERSGAGMMKRIRLAVVEGAFTLLIGLTTALGSATVLFIGVRHVERGVITTGDLILVMAYLLQLYAPLRALSKSITTLQSSFASAERAFSILDELPEVPEVPNANPLVRARGEVEFRNVSCAYDGERPVLKEVSLAVEPGMRLGISGVTGAGKTTLVSLLTRFYDPTGGSILIDGLDLRAYRLADLRNQFAIVLQESVLFSTSIAENIGYARPEADLGEIIAAARAANVHDFIASLPDGYDTEVGERGMRLSGGERQRISLARAFLKDAPILILDEPTSSVDLKTEAAIMDAMERLMAGRTTFMIAHRLSTLERCDVRLEIEEGRVGHVHAEPEQIQLIEHPAARAWRALGYDGQGSAKPVIETLKEAKAGSAYRLTGPGFEPVIAKRGERDLLAVERHLYERVLPDLPVATPGYLGSTADNGDLWLFLQDAGDQRYLRGSPEHRELAAGWLARLHASAAQNAAAARLPDRGPGHYRRHLEAARELMRANRGNPKLTEDDRRVLDVAVSLLNALAARWAVLEATCEEYPRTLVHGDFVAKNVRVQKGPGSTLVAFDWELAGWGVPAADLASLAGSHWLERYAAKARRHGFLIDGNGAGSLAAAGLVFRYVAAFDWASQNLPYPWIEVPMLEIRKYVTRLAHAMHAAGL